MIGHSPRVPRRLALRIWSSALAGHAAELESRSSESSLRRAHRRGGMEGRGAASDRIEGRLGAADDLDRQAEVVRRWIGDKAMYGGADLPADVVAHVCGWIYVHGESTCWLRARIPALGPIDASDRVAVIKLVLAAER